jgi:hypothetical protein
MDDDQAERIEASLERIETLLDLQVAVSESLLAVLANIDSATAATAWHTMPHWSRWRASWRNAREVLKLTEDEAAEFDAELRWQASRHGKGRTED